jgi:hypothetical protein
MNRLPLVPALIGIAIASAAYAEPTTLPLRCGFPEVGDADFGLAPADSFSSFKGAVKRITLGYQDHGSPRRELFEFDRKGRLTKATSPSDAGRPSYQIFAYDGQGRLMAEKSVRGDGNASGIIGREYVYLERGKAKVSIELEYRKTGWEASRATALVDPPNGDAECYEITVSRYMAFGDKYALSNDRTTWKQVSAVGSQLAAATPGQGVKTVAANEREAQDRILPLIDCLQQNSCGTSGPRKSAGDAGVPVQRAFGVVRSRDGELDKFTTYWGDLWFKDGLMQATDNETSQQAVVGGGRVRRERMSYQYEFDRAGNWTRRDKFVDSVKADDGTVTRKIEYYK